MLDEVLATKMFSTCDGYTGYHQVCIWKGDILKTTLTTPMEHLHGCACHLACTTPGGHSRGYKIKYLSHAWANLYVCI
jgi:hypothetical protein